MQGDVLVGEVGVVDAGGARPEHAVVGEEPGGRAAVGGPAGVVLGGLLGQVHVQRGPPLLGPPRHGRQLVGGHGPYGVDGRPDPCVIPFLEKLNSVRPRRRRVPSEKRSWWAFGRLPPKPEER